MLPDLSNLPTNQAPGEALSVCILGKCSVCTKEGQCLRCVPSWWDRIPARLQDTICTTLLDAGALEQCDPKERCRICAFHIRFALQKVLHKPAQMLIQTLLEEALCSYANFTPEECEEWMSADQCVYVRWVGE